MRQYGKKVIKKKTKNLYNFTLNYIVMREEGGKQEMQIQKSKWGQENKT